MVAARSLRVERGSRPILRDISLEIHPGEVVAVIGPNGAGKSTLLGALSGDLRPAGGSVTFEGREVGGMSMAERARCRAVLPQQSTLAFPFAVEEVVLLGRLPFNGGITGRVDREIADEAMRRTGVLHLRGRLYTTLSGGERQRAQLARVLAQIIGTEPGSIGRYIFLDEPTSSLDLAHQHGTLEIARRMADDGCGVLAILHDLNLAATHADRVAILLDGRIISSGRPREVLTSAAIEGAFGVAATIIEHPYLDLPVVISGGGAPPRATNNGSTTYPINHNGIS